MTTASPAVKRAARQHEDTLGATLADAFRDDPVVEFLIPADVSGREERMLTFFTSMARSYLRRDKHAFVADEGRGAALWAPPGSWRLPPAEIMRETPASIKAFGRNLPKALRVLTQVESLHPKEPHHWYLGYLGTRCDSQGMGVGSAMLPKNAMSLASRPSTSAGMRNSTTGSSRNASARVAARMSSCWRVARCTVG